MQKNDTAYQLGNTKVNIKLIKANNINKYILKHGQVTDI